MRIVAEMGGQFDVSHNGFGHACMQLTRETKDLAKGRDQVLKLATETAALQAEAHRLRTQV